MVSLICAFCVGRSMDSEFPSTDKAEAEGGCGIGTVLHYPYLIFSAMIPHWRSRVTAFARMTGNESIQMP